MKVIVFANETKTQQIVNDLAPISLHCCTTDCESLASEQVKFELGSSALCACVDALIAEIGQEALVVCSSELAEIAAYAAAKLNAPVVAQASALKLEGSDVVVENMVYGGSGVRSCKLSGAVKFIALSPNIAASENAPAPISATKRSVDIAPGGVAVLTSNLKQASDVDLSKAKAVVAVGRGFGAQSELELAEALAKKLGAQIACSRPIAETEKWLPKSRYVGISANIIAPDLYVAVGISGQVQHIVGCVNAKKIVVINKDEKAPFFQSADLGIVGDLKEILPQL